MKNKNNTIEEQLCNLTTEYTCLQLKNLIREATDNERDFDENLLKDLKEITFAYNYIDEVEELEVDFPLHNKKEDLLTHLDKIRNSKNLIEKECYLGQIYNTYSNYCNKCNYIDYLKRNDLKEFLLNNISIKDENIKTIIDIWISTLDTFNCQNKAGVSIEFQKQLSNL